MSSSSASNDLRQGIESARAGHRLLARLHLAQAIDFDPNNDAHWLWMAWVAEAPAAAVDHLQRALDINPDNEIARAGLIWSKTMAEWDFARALSPRATLAAVAEREAAVVPAFEPPTAVAEPEFEQFAEQPAFAEPEAIAQPEQPSQEAPAQELELDPAVEATSQPETPPPPSTDAFRPESIPIDQLTGMYLGEGMQLVGDKFAGFDVHASAVEVMQDPTASLATPFPGAVNVGELKRLRPSSVELGAVFADVQQRPQAEESAAAEQPSQPSFGDPDFKTTTPTALGEARVAERREVAPAPGEDSFVEITPAAADGADAGDAAAHASKPRQVMIVDDSPTVCKIVAIALKKRGFEVSSAADGVEAMALIASDRPDLILLDITMPRMDGYQLCKLIKGYPDTKSIPVILLSGKDGFFDRVRGKLVGCSDYITKPFDPELLMAAVERFLPAPAVLEAT